MSPKQNGPKFGSVHTEPYFQAVHMFNERISLILFFFLIIIYEMLMALDLHYSRSKLEVNILLL